MSSSTQLSKDTQCDADFIKQLLNEINALKLENTKLKNTVQELNELLKNEPYPGGGYPC